MSQTYIYIYRRDVRHMGKYKISEVGTNPCFWWMVKSENSVTLTLSVAKKAYLYIILKQRDLGTII